MMLSHSLPLLIDPCLLLRADSEGKATPLLIANRIPFPAEAEPTLSLFRPVLFPFNS